MSQSCIRGQKYWAFIVQKPKILIGLHLVCSNYYAI